MSDKLIDEAVKFLGSKSTSNPFQTAKENLAELKQSTVSNYLKKAIPDHDMLNVARRNTTGDEQKELARKEAQRKQGISKAVTRLDKKEEVEDVAEGGPFSYGAKKPRKGSVADLADKKRREQERGKLPIEPRDQQVGTAKVTKGVSEGSVSEAQYNDDDHYAIHPDTGKVMDSWSKRDSRVNAVMSQQHKEKGHIIKTGRELNYSEYAKSKNESIEEDFTKMKDHELKQWINTRQQNALAHNLTSKRQEQLKQAQDELKKRKS